MVAGTSLANDRQPESLEYISSASGALRFSESRVKGREFRFLGRSAQEKNNYCISVKVDDIVE